MTDTGTASIMMVDDEPTNLRLLEDMMKSRGYAMRSFRAGRLALESAAHNPPDLILLDINMPEMNGFEVCERLKSDARLARIPVIFLSALNETEDKVKALRSGGVDYVTKPFQLAEVQARVETHLELYRLRREVERHNERLEETVQARTRELAEAHAQLRILDRTKSDFLRLIAHEFRTPLNGLLGIAQLVLDEPGTDPELRRVFHLSRERIVGILDQALLLTRIDLKGEGFVCNRVALTDVLAEAIAQLAEFASSKLVRIDWVPEKEAFVLGRNDLLARAFRALLETAVKFSERGGAVRLVCDAAPGGIQTAIECRGGTVPPEAIPGFFDLFGICQDSTPAGQLGLDPPVACRILALFGGSVTIANLDPAGVRIVVSLRPAPE